MMRFRQPNEDEDLLEPQEQALTPQTRRLHPPSAEAYMKAEAMVRRLLIGAKVAIPF